MFLEYTKKKLINKSIVEYLQVKNQDIISVSGAGGKTSTIKIIQLKNLDDIEVDFSTSLDLTKLRIIKDENEIELIKKSY